MKDRCLFDIISTVTHDKHPRKIIAVVGKGGAGKTAVAAMMAGALASRDANSRTLLIDADPAGGLAFAMGVKVTKTIGEVREEVIRSARKKDPSIKEQIANSIDYYILESLIEKPRFGFLAMGRGEAVGCFCPVNTLLREAVKSLAEDFDRIIIDGEAGIEQIMRQVMKSVDTLLVVSDLSVRGLNTVALIKNLVRDKGILQNAQIVLAINRVNDESDFRSVAEITGLAPAASIPDDPMVREWDSKSKSLYEMPPESASMIAISELVEKLFFS